MRPTKLEATGKVSMNYMMNKLVFENCDDYMYIYFEFCVGKTSLNQSKKEIV